MRFEFYPFTEADFHHAGAGADKTENGCLKLLRDPRFLG